jgi:iron transport multicopper oxidase
LSFQGTYWYHSHFRAQYCDGLRGVLIIDDPNDPHKYLYDVDNGEKRHLEGSVHRAEVSSRRHRYHSRGLVSLSFDGSSPGPVSLAASVGNRDGDYVRSAFNSTLINGKGRYPDGPSNVSLAIVNVKQDLRSVCYPFSVWVYFDFSHYISYRFRLVSISCDPSFNFSIDSHQMTIIEVDGVNTQPLLVDSIQIFAGARILIQLPCNAN